MSNDLSCPPRPPISNVPTLTSNELIAQVPSFPYPVPASAANDVAPIATSAHVGRGAQGTERTSRQTFRSFRGRTRPLASQEGAKYAGPSNDTDVLRQRRTLYTQLSRARQEQRMASLFDTVEELTAEVARLEAANHELEKDVMYWKGFVTAMETM